MESQIAFQTMVAEELREVRAFINALLEIHPGDVDYRNNTISHKAFDLAVIITYGRIFKKNWGFDNSKALLVEIQSHYSPEQTTLHNKVIDSRDQEYAHSDASVNDIQVYKEGLFQSSRRVIRQPLSREELLMLKDMAVGSLSFVEQRKSDLVKKFRSIQN